MAFGRVWGGFGEGLGRVWGGFGDVLGAFKKNLAGIGAQIISWVFPGVFDAPHRPRHAERGERSEPCEAPAREDLLSLLFFGLTAGLCCVVALVLWLACG